MKYSTVNYDYECRKLISHLREARSSGNRRLDDLLSFIIPRVPRKLSRSGLNRAIRRLHELGLDPGLDDLSTARRHGRPCK
jgi:hypothetical protein